MRTLRLIAAALLLAGCAGAADLLSPGTKGPLPARLALTARLPALQQAGALTLRVTATYERADGSQAPLGTQRFDLSDARTQDVPVPLDLGPCLGDAQRRGGGAGEQACTVRLAIALLQDGRLLDEQSVGPLVLQPGVTVATPTAVTLHEVRTVRVNPPAAAVTRPDGSIRLEIGATSALAAVALDPSGAALAGRTATWRTSNAAVATVGEGTGLVTGVAPGTARITASMNGREASVDYTVVPRTSVVTVAAAGTGSGIVLSSPGGIECRVTAGVAQGACSFAFPGDVPVTLQAIRQTGSAFGGWGDACATAGAADRCTLTADQARSVRATFVPERAVSVSNGGDGSGLVGSVPGGIACRFSPDPSGTCSATFAEGTSVTLSAGATAPDAFLGWGGACEGTTAATCTITVGPATGGVSARFARPQALTVDVGGTGEGTVSGGPIACVRRADATTGTCSATAAANTVVTLTAAPDANSAFAGWTGACSGTGACTVTVDRARSVGATFTRRQATLTVAVSGAGAGTVSVAGQACTLAAGGGSQSCALRVDLGRPLSLAAAPATGSQFGTWSGACAASGTAPGCTVTLSADASVGATFVPGAVRVTVTGGANTTGGGGVSGGPSEPPISCRVLGASATGTCEGVVQIGATVTLSAAPDQNSTFGSWGGACAGTGPTCTFTVREAASVSARFLRQQVPLTVAVGGSGAGTVSLNGAAFCTLAPNAGTNACPRLVDAGAPVTLTLAPASGSTATWGGPCADAPVTGPCTFTATGSSVGVPVSFSLVGVVSVRPAAGYTGGGVVRSSDQRIDCTIAPTTGAISGTCDAVYPTGATVSLSLVSFTMERFVGAWSGLCTSSSTTCTFTAPTSGGTARIALPEFVNLSIGWTGAGSVATTFADSAGRLLRCTAVPGNFGCSGSAPEGSTVTVTATSQFAGGFRGWTDGCAAAGTAPTCTRTVPFRTSGNPAYVVAARFDFEALVDVNGGAGTVSLQGVTGPNGACTNTGLGTTTCSLQSPTRTATLVATPGVGNVFVGWDSPACVASAPTCTVDVTSANGRVTATFQAQGPLALEFDRDPASTGGGRVITSFGTCNLPQSGRNGACSEVAPVGSTRSYTAQPFAGSQFVSWGGPCAGQTGTTCTLSPVTVGGTVTARFDLTPTQVLTVEGINSVTPGTGTVTSAPAGISCGITGNQETGTCTGTFALNANVSLTPAPAAGSVFSAWSGACTGSTVPCAVPMNGPQTVGALFVPSAPTTLALAFAGTSNSDGTLTASNGLSCSGNVEAFEGDGCAPTGGSVPTGQPVTVTTSAPSGAAFVGWTAGPCTGQFVNPCTFTPVSPTTVAARFGTQRSVSVEVEQQGNANQATWDAKLRVETIRDTVVISVPPVPLVVTGPYTLYVGDQVRFTATPGPGGGFSGWVGDCASFGTNPVCTLTITANTAQVRAVYSPGAALGADPSPGPRATPLTRRLPRLNRAR